MNLYEEWFEAYKRLEREDAARRQAKRDRLDQPANLTRYAPNDASVLWSLALAFDRAFKPETKTAILKRIYGGADAKALQEKRQRARDLDKRLDLVILQAVDSTYPWWMRVYRRYRRWAK